MGSTSSLEFEALLQPISPEHPAGEDLRQDMSSTPLYYAIKDVRTEARAAERQGQFEPVIGAAEAAAWKPVIKTGTEALQQRSKDLEVVSWMTEALLRVEGFAGLRDGFRLGRQVVETFWEDPYPRVDEDGLETKLAPITGLNGLGTGGTLIAPISRIPILEGASTGPLATWSCVQAQDLERATPEVREERISGGATSMELVATAVRETPPTELAKTLQDIDQCLEEWAALHAALSERCGSESPPSSAVRGALESCQQTLRYVARDSLPMEAPAEEETAAAAPQEDQPGIQRVVPTPSGEISTRDDAFKLLSKVADFFRRTEPHTPISFMLQRTVRWGSMPLPDLLQELIPDESARATYQQLTGVVDGQASPDQS